MGASYALTFDVDPDWGVAWQVVAERISGSRRSEVRSAALPSPLPTPGCADSFGPSDDDPAHVVRGRHPDRTREPPQRGPTLDLMRPIGRRHRLHARQGDAVTGSTAHHRRPGGHIGHQGTLGADDVDLSFGSTAVPRAYFAPHAHRDDPLLTLLSGFGCREVKSLDVDVRNCAPRRHASEEEDEEMRQRRPVSRDGARRRRQIPNRNMSVRS